MHRLKKNGNISTGSLRKYVFIAINTFNRKQQDFEITFYEVTSQHNIQKIQFG